MDNIQILLIFFSVSFLGIIFEMTRKRKIRENYSLIWFLIGFVMLLFSVFRGLLDIIAEFLGIYYAPSLILTITFLMVLGLGIHFTLVVSALTESNKKAIQEIGILKQKLADLETEIAGKTEDKRQ
jgi:hypothetical protein